MAVLFAVVTRLQNTVVVRGKVTPVAAGHVKSMVRMFVTYYDPGGNHLHPAQAPKPTSQVPADAEREGESWWVDVELRLGVAQDAL